MKIFNEITNNILILVGFVAVITSIIFLQKEIVEKIFIVSPFILLWISFILEKAKEKRRTKKDEIEKQKNIQYFFNNFIEWIDGGKERSSYLEYYVLKKFNKYERYYGISILKIDDLSPDEWQNYNNLRQEGDFFFMYKIYVLEGKYILEYSIEHYGPDSEVHIDFIKPKTYRDDYEERKNEEMKTRKNMIDDIIGYVKKEHNIQLEYKEKSKKQV